MVARRLAAVAPLAGVLLCAAALQTALLLRLPTISADGIIFVRLARELVAAPVETMRSEDQHPGYPAMLLAGTRVVQSLGYRADPEAWMAGAVLVSFTCGLLSVAVVWLFTRDLFDARIASVAAIAFTVLPVPRIDAVDAQSDTPHALFYLLSAWMAATGISGGNPWRLALAGLSSGVAYWIRPEGLEVALVGVPVLAWHAWRSAWPWRKAALSVGALACTALAVALPYGLLAGKLTSKQLPFAKVIQPPTYVSQVATIDDAPAAEAPANPAGEPAGAAPARRYSPLLVLGVLGGAIAAFVTSICQGFKFIFLPLYLLGDFALKWRRPAVVQIVFLTMLGGLHIVVLLGVYVMSGYIAHRHVIPLVGLAMPSVGLGVVQFGHWAAGRLHARPAIGTAATLAVASAVVLPYTLRRLNWEFMPVIAATRWIEAQPDAATGILCNSPYVDFYGQLPVALLGPTAPTVEHALAVAPQPVAYNYVLLHVGAHAYDPAWLERLRPTYQQVLEVPDRHSSGKLLKVIVLKSVAPGPRQAAREPR